MPVLLPLLRPVPLPGNRLSPASRIPPLSQAERGTVQNSVEHISGSLVFPSSPANEHPGAKPLLSGAQLRHPQSLAKRSGGARLGGRWKGQWVGKAEQRGSPPGIQLSHPSATGKQAEPTQQPPAEGASPSTQETGVRVLSFGVGQASLFWLFLETYT